MECIVHKLNVTDVADDVCTLGDDNREDSDGEIGGVDDGEDDDDNEEEVGDVEEEDVEEVMDNPVRISELFFLRAIILSSDIWNTLLLSTWVLVLLCTSTDHVFDGCMIKRKTGTIANYLAYLSTGNQIASAGSCQTILIPIRRRSSSHFLKQNNKVEIRNKYK